MQYPLSYLFVIFLIPMAFAIIIFRFPCKFPGNHTVLVLIITTYIFLTIFMPVLIGIYYYDIEVNSKDFIAMMKVIAVGRLFDTIGTRWPLIIKRLW